MPDANANVPARDMDVSAKIIRACRECNGPRQIDTDCASCGLTEPPEVIDLGIIAAQRGDPLKSAWWNAVGTRLADRRIHKANKAIKELCGSRR